MAETSSRVQLVALSQTTTRFISFDSKSKTAEFVWKSTSKHAGTSATWLKNNKAVITALGGMLGVVPNTSDNKREWQPILSLGHGAPILCRVTGDSKCLVVVRHSSLSVYELQPILSGNGSAATPLVTLTDQDKPIVALVASTVSNHMASSSSSGSVYLHEVGASVHHTLGALPSGPAMMTAKRCLAFSNRPSPSVMLAAGADDGQVLVWQLAPGGGTHGGPVIMPAKHRGRVMGVGFAPLRGVANGVLVSCAENGQLMAFDLPKLLGAGSGGLSSAQKAAAVLTVDLQVQVSTMVVSDDGHVLAIGTRDGRVGLLRVEDLITQQPQAVMGCITVANMDTHLEIADLAFQHSRSSGRDSIGSSVNSSAGVAASREVAAAAAAAGAGAGAGAGGAVGHGPGGEAAAAGVGRVAVEDRRASGAMASTAGAPQAAVAGLTGGVPPHKEVPHPGVVPRPGMPAAAASAGAGDRGAAAAAPVPKPLPGAPPGTGGTSSRSLHPQGPGAAGAGGGAPKPTPVPPLNLRRLSDAGDVAAARAAPAAPGTAAAAVDEQHHPALPSPSVVAVMHGSPAASPSRLQSPRVSLAGVQMVGAAGGTARLPYGAAAAGAEAAGSVLRTYMEEVRTEQRELFRALQMDVSRQLVGQQMEYEAAVAVMRQENRELSAQVQELKQLLQQALRFSVI